MKKLRFLRYRNLSNELAKYGYEYTLKKAMVFYGIIVLAAALIGVLYRLDIPYIIAIAVLGLLFSPIMLLQAMKGRYHSAMFSLANNYMEQFLYSFKRTGTVLNTLTEVANTAAAEGEFCYRNNYLVEYADMKPGDLIFYSYSNNGRFMNITHVAIYVGDGMVVEAANENIGVVYREIQNRSSIVFIGRPR